MRVIPTPPPTAYCTVRATVVYGTRTVRATVVYGERYAYGPASREDATRNALRPS